MAALPEKLYALHDFEAENPDEVSFKAGDTILVVEKDDAYGDGWWQGTNVHGHTGLFPFSYTTYDQALALGNKAALASTTAAAAAAGSAPGSATLPPSYSNATTASDASTSATGPGGITAEINNALTELQVNGGGLGSGSAASRGEPSMPGGLPMLSSTSNLGTARKNSMESQSRSVGAGAADDTVSIGDGDTEEDGGAYGAGGADGEEDEYQSRSAARAALAANAKKNFAQADAQQKADDERRRTSAMAKFEEEERKQRELLLLKERERKEAVESGKLDLSSAKEKKSKAAPIAGVEMSDESDSEGSLGGFDDDLQTGKTYSPLFQTTQRDSGDQAKKNGRSSLGAGAFPTSDSNGTDTSLAAAAATAAAAAASLPAPSESNVSTIGQQRSLSPIPSSTHVISASNSQATSPKLDSQPVGTLNSLQRISSDISTRDRSLTADSFTAGAPTTTTGASETPVTGSGPGTTTAPSSIAASRPAGDPYDWSIEQVCDWARSRGWDEANVVGKFAEHEITGDVLLELDVNMLKEIDITAFGTRHKVAVAIRDLKKATQEGDRSATPGVAGSALGAGSLRHASSFSQDRGSVSSPFSTQFPQSMGGQDEEPMLSPSAFSNRSSSGAPGVGAFSNRSSAGAAGIGLGAPPSAPGAGQRDFSNLTAPPGATAGFSPDPNQFNNGDREVMSDDEGTGKGLGKFGMKRRNVKSSEDPAGGQPLGSPRKRESGGSGRGAGERQSFFANLRPRSRQDGGNANAVSGSNRPFSRFVPKRLGNSSQNDLKSQISGPTGTPQYDSAGDTARRSRASANSDKAGGEYESWSAGATPTTAEPPREGSVMSRIRPVDFEGWMKKKGERYNAWKPRYLALKGSDLVILRDPDADKIKGYVSMKGYKLISDENVNPGKYGFKLLHEHEKPHYFSSEDPIVVRDWMKALMKATIGRDHSFPVISSYNNATISLKEAQRMNPPPRPPSPTSRARTQRARARENPDQLTAKDAAVLMGLSSSQGLSGQGYR